jgi:hypothetical protein
MGLRDRHALALGLGRGVYALDLRGARLTQLARARGGGLPRGRGLTRADR